MQKPLILVTNDDGITAPGIRNLVEFMNELGEVREVHEWLEENDVRQHAEPGKMRS